MSGVAKSYQNAKESPQDAEAVAAFKVDDWYRGPFDAVTLAAKAWHDAESPDARDPQGAGTRTETPNERYERLAEQFYRESGKMAPGKDVPAEYASDDYENRVRLWRAFCRRIETTTTITREEL